MTYRELPRNEWSRVESIFVEYGGTLPQLGRIVVAEDGDEIKGLFTVQAVTHLEPMWIGDPRVSIRKLVGIMRNIIGDSDFYTFTSNDRAERLAVLFGLTEKKGWKVFGRR